MKLNRDLPFFAIVDNVRSLENVGSIFRTADALGIMKIYLVGVSGILRRGDTTVLHPKIAKTALGAQNSVPWEYWANGRRLAEKLKKEGVKIICLEQTANAADIYGFKPKFPLALAVGNEIKGVSKTILGSADKAVQIPMLGKKESLNVAVAFGIAGFEINRSRFNIPGN